MSFETSLNQISDVLQLPLTSSDGKVQGSRQATWAAGGLSIPMTVTASKLFAGEQVGVLAHIHGDLHVVVSHYAKTGALSAYLIDGAKVKSEGVRVTPDALISKKMSLRDVVDSLKGSIVGAFYWKNSKWQALKLPD